MAAEVEESSGSEFDDHDPCRLTVRVSGPGHVGELLREALARPGRIARLAFAEDSDDSDAAPASAEEVDRALDEMDTKLCFSMDYGSEQGGDFRALTEKQLRDTFQSFTGAVVVSVETTARLDAAAWRGLAAALPEYRRMQCLELQRTRVEPPELEALLKAAAQCPALEKLHLQVDADGFGRGPNAPWFPQLRELALEQGTTGCMDVLIRAEDWLPRMPKLRKLDFWLSARSPVQAIFDGFKRGVLAGVREHGMLALRECEATVFYYQDAMPEGDVRCDLLNPAHACAFRMRPEDYARAWSFAASEEPPYSLNTEEESWRTARLSPGVLIALRHRQWQRHLLLHTFSRAPAMLADNQSEEADTSGLVRRLAGMPRDLWCAVLEWYLGGRIFVGRRARVASKRPYPSEAAPTYPGSRKRRLVA